MVRTSPFLSMVPSFVIETVVTYLGAYYRTMRARHGAPVSITAAAHKLARIISHLVTTG
jgi:hypothetical protein